MVCNGCLSKQGLFDLFLYKKKRYHLRTFVNECLSLTSKITYFISSTELNYSVSLTNISFIKSSSNETTKFAQH